MAIYNEISQGGLRCGGSSLVPPVLWVGNDAEDIEAYSRFVKEWENVQGAGPEGTAPIFQALATYNETAAGGLLAGMCTDNTADTTPVIESFQYTFDENQTSNILAATAPTDVEENDMLLAIWLDDNNSVITTPAGWTPLTNQVDGTSFATRAFFKRATQSDSTETSFDFTSDNTFSNKSVMMYRISGTDIVIDTSETSVTDGEIDSTNSRFPIGQYIPGDNHTNQLIRFGAILSDTLDYTTPAGHTLTDDDTSNTIQFVAFEKDSVDATNASIFVDTSSGSGEYVAYNIGVQGGCEVAEVSMQQGPPIVTGGIEGGGDASIQSVTTLDSSGGAEGGGQSLGGVTIIAQGGAEAGGQSIAGGVSSIDGSGGAEAGGGANIQDFFDEVGSGGVEAGGDAAFTYDDDGSGGVLAGGDSIVGITLVASGGALAGGDVISGITITTQGGVEAGGEGLDFVSLNETASGGVSAGAIANENIFINKVYNITDPTKIRVIVGGEANTKLDIKYIASGGVEFGGEAGVNFSFPADLELLWRVNALVRKDMAFLWNTGQLQLFWYRVVGEQSQKCEPLQPCCQKVITNIFARTPAELCDKLRARRFQFKIDSVQKFERPAENSAIVDDDGCNDLIPVEICEVPACADFCVDAEPLVSMGMETRVQVDSFFSYEPESSTVYMGGSADVTLFRILPEFTYEASGGVEIRTCNNDGTCFDDEQTADWISSGYGPTWNGGFVIGGSAKQKSSHWDYCGGEWPLLTGDLGPLEAESLEEEITDVPWGAIDRVLTDNALPTQVDLSFGRTSEHLIVRGFDINIPDDAEILGVIVKVDRSASNIGVVDDSVYLLVGDEIISDNLANPPDWPLIQTEWWYGNTGNEQDNNRPWVAEDSELPPLSAEDLNDDDFGFAIRIKSRTALDEIFAFITYIDMAIYYQDEGDVHILRTGGEAKVVSSAYSYEFSDGLEIGGTAGLRLGRRYLTDGISPTLTAAFSTGGSYGRHFKYEPDLGYLTDRIKRGVECGGSALVTPYIYDETQIDVDGVDLGGTAIVSTGKTPSTGARVGGSAHLNPLPVTASGGASMGGAAKVTPYIEVASGGLVVDYDTPEELTLGGEAFCKPSWQHIEATGGATMGGTVKVTPYIEIAEGGVIAATRQAGQSGVINEVGQGGVSAAPKSTSPVEELFYDATGSVAVEGEANYRSSAYHFTSDGNAIFVLGSSAFQASDLGTQKTDAGAEFKVLEFNFDYGEETTEEFEATGGVVTRCDCPEMSFITEVSHNMARDNRFAQFLVRNNFTIPRILTMYYNAVNDSWQTNLHYRGVSSRNNNVEDWNLVFELRCTANAGGIAIGNNIWQFSVQISLEDVITGEDYETRILVGIIPDALCSSGELDFRVDYDTDLDFVEVSPNAVIYNNILYDNIGLFKNRAWTESPILTFEVSQVGIDDPTPRYDASGFGDAKPMKPV